MAKTFCQRTVEFIHQLYKHWMHVYTHIHSNIALRLLDPSFHLMCLWALPLSITQRGQWKAGLEALPFHGFFHFKTKDYSINVCNTHFPLCWPWERRGDQSQLCLLQGSGAEVWFIPTPRFVQRLLTGQRMKQDKQSFLF